MYTIQNMTWNIMQLYFKRELTNNLPVMNEHWAHTLPDMRMGHNNIHTHLSIPFQKTWKRVIKECRAKGHSSCTGVEMTIFYMIDYLHNTWQFSCAPRKVHNPFNWYTCIIISLFWIFVFFKNAIDTFYFCQLFRNCPHCCLLFKKLPSFRKMNLSLPFHCCVNPMMFCT